MHLAVCVKHVPDTDQVRMDPERGTLVREGVPGILNPLDAHAVEAAVALRDLSGGKVTAVSMGPRAAEQSLREALARGCDDALLLTDQTFAGSDTWATSYVLACAVRRLRDVELVVCGKQAVDGDTAQVGPGLAAHLGWPQATCVVALEPGGPQGLVVECLTDYGTETLRVPLPAVLTVVKDLNVPRLPSLVSALRARRAVVETWGAPVLGGDPAEFGLEGSPTRVVRVFTPPPRGQCMRWDDGPSAAHAIVRALRERGVV
jgi:electron transfer flavoprotein beta subunit